MKVSDDLRNFEYISLSMLLTLAEANVRSLDDLADLDNDELVEILAEHELTDDSEAGDIIMAARAHWFADEDDAESDAVASDEASADSAAEDGGDAADS
jgi:N utilization substance protein A